MGRLFIVNYNTHEVNAEDLLNISKSLERVIDKRDKLILLPEMIHMQQVSTEELIYLRDYIDSIIDAKGDIE